MTHAIGLRRSLAGIALALIGYAGIGPLTPADPVIPLAPKSPKSPIVKPTLPGIYPPLSYTLEVPYEVGISQ